MGHLKKDETDGIDEKSLKGLNKSGINADITLILQGFISTSQVTIFQVITSQARNLSPRVAQVPVELRLYFQ